MAACLLLSACSKADQTPHSDSSNMPGASGAQAADAAQTGQAEQMDRAREILAGMTLDEKVGQMFLARCPASDGAKAVEQYKLGGFVLFYRDFEGETPQTVSKTIQGYQQTASVPMLIAVDEEGGTVNRVSKEPALRNTPFLSPQALYRQGGFDRIREDTAQKATLLKSLGINVNLAPVCDVSQTPGDFIYARSFGKDAEETAQYVRTVVEEMNRQQIGGVLKHFPGYGGNEDTHAGVVRDNRPYETFRDSDLIPFREGIHAGAGAVLVSHNIVECIDPDRPASLSQKVNRLLRKELAFDGVAITDDLAMDGIRDFTGDDSAAVLAVLAGNDLLCCTNYQTQVPAVKAAIERGEIPLSRVEEAVLRILRWKLDLGIIQ